MEKTLRLSLSISRFIYGNWQPGAGKAEETEQKTPERFPIKAPPKVQEFENKFKSQTEKVERSHMESEILHLSPSCSFRLLDS